MEEKAALNLEQIADLEERRDSVRNQLAHRNPYVIIRNYYDICRTKEEANEQSIEVCDLDKYEIVEVKGKNFVLSETHCPLHCQSDARVLKHNGIV